MSVEAKFGRDQIRFGSDNVLFGEEIARFLQDNILFAFGISAEYPDGTSYHVSTLHDDLTVGGITYTAVGPDVLQIGSQQTSLNGQARMTLALSSIEPAHRSLFLQDPGRVRITVRMLYSVDGGATWQVINRFHTGYLSRPQLRGGEYAVEISIYRDELNRGFDESWSNENQERDFPGDKGLEHLAVLSSGLDIRWP